MPPERRQRFADRTAWELAENRLTRTLANLRAEGTPVLDLTQSNPTVCGFSYDFAAMAEALAQPQIERYQPDPRGLRGAREAVAEYYRLRDAMVTPDDLVLTAGTSEAYSFLFRLLCNPGDEVLVPAPGYPLFEFLADLCDVKLVRYPLLYDHGWQIDFAALAGASSGRTRAVIVVHPNNPTGYFTNDAEQRRLAEFCKLRHLALIADEVFLDFSLTKPGAQSFASQNGTLAFALSGISKICGLPQMKLAWVAVHGPTEEKREALARLEVIADAYLSVGTPVQLALPRLLGSAAKFQSQVLARIATNLADLDRQLGQQTNCTRLACAGGWSAVLRVPALQSDEDLAVALLTEKGVAVHPGHFYDFAQPGHAVVSLIVPQADFSDGIRRVLEFFR